MSQKPLKQKSKMGAEAGSRTRPSRLEPGLLSRWHVAEAWRRLLERDWFWVVAFLLIGSWLLAPEGAWLRQQVETGDIAQRDFVSPRDALLIDEETTRELRQRAQAEVLPVYDFDQGRAAALDEALARFFAAGRLYSNPGAQSVEGVELSEEQLAQLPEVLAQAAPQLRYGEPFLELAAENRFSVELEDRVRTVISVSMTQGVVANKLLLLENRLRGVTLRLLPLANERVELDLYDYLGYPDEMASFYEIEVGRWRGWTRDQRSILTDFLIENTPPNIVENLGETGTRRDAAAQATEAVYTQVRRGQIIARRGDELTAADVRTIEELMGARKRAAQLVPLLGNLLLLLLVVLALQQGLRRTSLVRSTGSGLFGGAVFLLLGALVLTSMGEIFAEALAASFDESPFDSVVSYRYAVPHASLALITSLFYGRGAALLLVIMQAIVAGRIMGGDQMATTLYVLSSSLAAIYAIDRLRQRSTVTRAGLVVGAASMATAFMLATVGQSSEIRPVGEIGYDLLCAVVGGVLVAATTSFVVPIMESVLSVTTDIKLLELSDTNLPVLQRLAFEAPGTFQHSLMVANLAKAGCEAIGARAVLAYTGALYHDIGKVLRPMYFIENQRGDNPHDKLGPSMSALIVTNHVKEGAQLAREQGLPRPIVDAIEQHHGTRRLSFFYERAKELSGEGGVDEHTYRYPGPKPQDKEMGVLMLADGVEAASRTLHAPTTQAIRGVVRRLVDECVKEGELDETDLTLADLQKVSAAFERILETIYHKRIEYPGYDFNRRETSLRVVDAARG